MQELDIFESCRAVYSRVSADGKNFECISEPGLPTDSCPDGLGCPALLDGCRNGGHRQL